MPARNFLLYAVPALIWGSTWFTITFQLGKVDPLVSVVYRYVIAGAVMMGYCWLKGLPMKFAPRQHAFMLGQGALLFGINYWMAYRAEEYIPSGLMAVAFSTIVFANSLFGYVFLKRPINKGVLIGAVFGLSGTFIIFSKQFFGIGLTDEFLFGAGMAMLSVTMASLGNIISARNTGKGVPVIQANAYSMVYGCIITALLGLFMGKEFTFEYTQTYVLSLLYLSIIGSVVAFGFYLTLVGEIGADKASYALVIIPIISISLSAIFEGYQLTWMTLFGVIMIVMGNLFALRKKKPISVTN
ncbi:DMT family transporter [Reichenbachiella ulvae]|uniref:DMT family transporter n=1 Tax=Reichenbachiella ulvae TaxID=2980104 RepID=A0ABT3CP21_9BACT|nr:DMT family transporter [Reichenbachiella ulvae]MCV9385342.1 DMT family transporter [Reichenbachiella ulvae]